MQKTEKKFRLGVASTDCVTITIYGANGPKEVTDGLVPVHKGEELIFLASSSFKEEVGVAVWVDESSPSEFALLWGEARQVVKTTCNVDRELKFLVYERAATIDTPFWIVRAIIKP